jgi:hypothetical protein
MVIRPSPSVILPRPRIAAVLTGTRISRWHRRTATSRAKCETWRTAQATTTTAACKMETTSRTRTLKAARRNRWFSQGWASTTCKPKALKTSARPQWQLACAHAPKRGTQTRKTQISSEVNYIALYFVYHLGIRYNRFIYNLNPICNFKIVF